VNRGIKKLINNSKVPDMSKYNDLADYIMHNKATGGMSSESEADDLPESKIVLPEDYQDKKKGSSVAIKLHELGPRMKLKLHKIEEGFCRGNVVFHSVVKLDKGDIKKQSDSLKSKRELKDKRKKEQDANVKKKLDKKGPKKENKKEAGDDDYVTDPGEQSEVEEANADDNKEVVSNENKKEKMFANFQKNGKIIPNITSVVKRPAGISKGLWKKEAKRQLTGVTEKKERRGMRVKKEDKDKKPKDASVLGKRTKTSTSHGKNTSTFKTQNKRQRK
jgi:hypothetical protein